MNSLELLVKFASFGTAGVSVLAIFYIGLGIQKLPNNAPPWKPALMKKYMNMCIVIALICTLSGGVNAYFNRNKIVAANEQVASMGAQYKEQIQKVESEKSEISADLSSLRALLQQGPTLTPAVSAKLDSAEVKVNRLQLKPQKEMLKGAVAIPRQP